MVEIDVRFTVERAREREHVPELFLRRPPQPSTREVNMERIWMDDFGPTANPLEVDVRCLRRTTGAGEPRVSHGVCGVGSGRREP